jgi:hypothetical protein
MGLPGLLVGGIFGLVIGGAFFVTPPPANPEIICPHCHRRGGVTTAQVKRKKGISGAKATAAILTGGISILGTGLSRKEVETKAHCKFCGSTWHY